MEDKNDGLPIWTLAGLILESLAIGNVAWFAARSADIGNGYPPIHFGSASYLIVVIVPAIFYYAIRLGISDKHDYLGDRVSRGVKWLWPLTALVLYLLPVTIIRAFAQTFGQTTRTARRLKKAKKLALREITNIESDIVTRFNQVQRELTAELDKAKTTERSLEEILKRLSEGESAAHDLR